MILTRIFHGISKGDGQDVAANSLPDIREHCQIDKARGSGSEFGVTDCSDSPREREIFGLKQNLANFSEGALAFSGPTIYWKIGNSYVNLTVLGDK